VTVEHPNEETECVEETLGPDTSLGRNGYPALLIYAYNIARDSIRDEKWTDKDLFCFEYLGNSGSRGSARTARALSGTGLRETL